MIPTKWIVSWIDPSTGQAHEREHTQRAAMRGSMMMLRAQGMQSVSFRPVWSN
jgi:hypothetical protein